MCSKSGTTNKDNQTNKQRKSGRSRDLPGPCFGQLNTRYQSQNLSKVVPKTTRGSLLRGQLKSTSGFSSVVGTLLKLRPACFLSLRTTQHDFWSATQRGADYAKGLETCRCVYKGGMGIWAGSGTGSVHLPVRFVSGT